MDWFLVVSLQVCRRSVRRSCAFSIIERMEELLRPVAGYLDVNHKGDDLEMTLPSGFPFAQEVTLEAANTYQGKRPKGQSSDS